MPNTERTEDRRDPGCLGCLRRQQKLLHHLVSKSGYNNGSVGVMNPG